MKFIRTYGKTLLFFGIIGLIGGFFTGIYALNSYPEATKQQLIAEINAAGLNILPIEIALGLITAVQSVGYGIILGAIGIMLGKKIGTWKDEHSLTFKPLTASIAVAVAGGLAMILSDIMFFGKYSDAIMNSYATKPTIPYLIATVTYGAVIEEVILRLFVMSLVAFILHMLFERKEEKTSVGVLIIANVISSILFAAGHLPATAESIGLTPIIVLRCFILNGGIGLLFGRLYRKYGLRYSMIAHGGCHIVSKIIWILFI